MADAPSQMFVLVGTGNPVPIGEELEKLKLTHRRLGKAPAWLVLFSGTARELTEALRIRNGVLKAPGIAFPVSGYGGRADKSIWEWIQLNWPTDG